ncbi:hypothetical protein [Clostridioides difficile]|uniref:hypothetical protein n=1 Tax=Clostridioides difficile TaxID=1496 RepID=UPI001034CE28|nr:hypothetical protein [Clostridioides difficile]
MGKRAENKTDFKISLDKSLKEEFRYYSYINNSDMSKEVTKLIENYVKRAKRQEQKRNEVI